MKMSPSLWILCYYYEDEMEVEGRVWPSSDYWPPEQTDGAKSKSQLSLWGTFASVR